jgi:cobalt-zinc-cadmium efflux system protein
VEAVGGGLTTGWTQADAVASCAMAGLILLGSWPLLREAVRILMEGVPARLSLREVEEAMRAVPGVAGVHDLYIWSVASRVEAVSGHVIVADPGDSQRMLQDLCRLLSDRYGLGPVTPAGRDRTVVRSLAPELRAGTDRAALML